ncbi:MAG TPA: hypothetical protein VIY48_14980 [Candidatus Paceibacterota bacterium]|jgi:hypothetical protein
MEPIGSLAEAKQVEDFRHNRCAEGWQYIGSGAYRSAYLSPSGVVYKRQYSSDALNGDPYDCNRKEAVLYKEFADKSPNGVRLAPCYLHSNGVLAMEYIDGESLDYFQPEPAHLFKLVQQFGAMLNLWDLYGNNIKHCNGEAVIVDYAS